KKQAVTAKGKPAVT
ncbi:hypothetical protein MK338_10175, partial [Streptococcus vestibularis]|nr:hypothetical protein [Streptococcus vestibularis]